MQDKEILVKNWILKSEEALAEAQKAIEQNMLPSAQNRLYYALFYAVSALAQKNGFITSKHSQLRGWFNKEFIKPGKIDANYGKLYSNCFHNREKSDYSFTFKPNKENLQIDLNDARVFINIIKELINGNI